VKTKHKNHFTLLSDTAQKAGLNAGGLAFSCEKLSTMMGGQDKHNGVSAISKSMTLQILFTCMVPKINCTDGITKISFLGRLPPLSI
jgi:hypothetical protein